ncbi:Zn(2)-C6 fungal-specific transcription factor, partial [Phycomyces blakesleeanus NRRL 1555(-)]
ACVYCRRSHMTCDDGRPCQRCIKRSIGHMCHDEPKESASSSGSTTNSAAPKGSRESSITSDSDYKSSVKRVIPPTKYQSNDFLDSMGNVNLLLGNQHNNSNVNSSSNSSRGGGGRGGGTPVTESPIVNTTEKFFLTAADPSDGRLEDRLTEVINAKYEAGFLKPYNYVNGYARLQKYMDRHMSASSRQRILNVMGTFRPAFRSVAQSLTDIDLILVEEAFERLLLDYDRVFSSMGIPACLWRRTGEIYKGNKEFASLVNVPMETLREGRLCIYELMAEESSVNYWEKYGNIAFDPGQKAVLTSCLLRNPDREETSVISCCFSFTIRRDKYNIPVSITHLQYFLFVCLFV